MGLGGHDLVREAFERAQASGEVRGCLLLALRKPAALNPRAARK